MFWYIYINILWNTRCEIARVRKNMDVCVLTSFLQLHIIQSSLFPTIFIQKQNIPYFLQLTRLIRNVSRSISKPCSFISPIRKNSYDRIIRFSIILKSSAWQPLMIYDVILKPRSFGGIWMRMNGFVNFTKMLSLLFSP